MGFKIEFFQRLPSADSWKHEACDHTTAALWKISGVLGLRL